MLKDLILGRIHSREDKGNEVADILRGMTHLEVINNPGKVKALGKDLQELRKSYLHYVETYFRLFPNEAALTILEGIKPVTDTILEY